jgi:hypothetical protein
MILKIKSVKLALTDSPPFKGLISPFGLIEVHLGVMRNKQKTIHHVERSLDGIHKESICLIN